MLGIDEAGRGSVLGPLVVGGFLADPRAAAQLQDLGVRDSKLLSASRREEIYRELPHLGRCFGIALAPSVIDASVRRGELNQLEARTFGSVVRRACPGRAFVDACDPVASRFGREVAHWGRVRATTVDSRHHADRDLPIVGAASIVAKVRRDRAIARLAASLGTAIGSGYPSDPLTRRFVAETLRAGGPMPRFLRASWKTTETLMPKPAARTLETFAP